MTPPRAFSDLVRTAVEEKWCVRSFCTTCGALPFRKALRQVPREEAIAGLRLLSEEFLVEQADMFRLVIQELSLFGSGGELLGPLEGSVAGEQLRTDIEHRLRRSERLQSHRDAQTPEAIAHRRAQKKVQRMLIIAKHNERKMLLQDGIRAAALELNATHPSRILQLICDKDFGVPLRAIGGLVYKRLCEHYESNPIQEEELLSVSKLAALHSGHWRKLLDRLVPSSRVE